MTKAVLLLLCCLVAGAWAASANPKKLTREQEKAFLAALGMSGIRGKIRARRDASLRDHTSSKGENICYRRSTPAFALLLGGAGAGEKRH